MEITMSRFFTLVFMLLISYQLNTYAATIASKQVTVRSPVIDLQGKPENNSTRATMEIENTGDSEIVIVAATAPIADQIQLHKMQDNQHKMRQVKQISVKPHKAKKLKHDGVHLMLIGLRENLMPNKRIPIQLIFDDGSWLTVDAIIRPFPASSKR